MPFIFLLLFALICLQSPWPGLPSWLTPIGSGILVGTLIFTSWLLAGIMARTVVWQMQRDPEQRGTYLRYFQRLRRYHFFGLLIAYLLLLYGFGWGQVLQTCWSDLFQWLFQFPSDSNLPGLQLALMIPFFTGLILSWERFYLVEKTAFELIHVHEAFLSKRSYLLSQIQHQMLLVMPPILFLLIQQLFTMIPNWNEESYLAALFGIGMMATAFLSMPILLRYFLGLTPLPSGPLRERLEQLARRLGFRYSNILVWNTHQLSANALVTGFVPWTRYIVLTDRLIDELVPEEIEAVFGHEIGHIKHHHLIFYMAFFLTSFILLGFFWDILKDFLRPQLDDDVREILKTLSSFGKIGLLSAYTLFIFGFLSRLCERQADLYGSNTVSTEVFIRALEKVADINGISRARKGNWLRLSWQHPTIAQRVDFLRDMHDNPMRTRRFQVGVSMMQLASLYVLASLLWCFELTRVLKFLAEF